MQLSPVSYCSFIPGLFLIENPFKMLFCEWLLTALMHIPTYQLLGVQKINGPAAGITYREQTLSTALKLHSAKNRVPVLKNH